MKIDVRAASARRDAGSAGELYPWERALGARLLTDGLAQFRVWAPRASTPLLQLADNHDAIELEHVGHGVYEAVVPAAAGNYYRFVFDGVALPDPCTRWQPAGLRGPS